MPDVVLRLGQTGCLEGVNPADAEHYNQFRRFVRKEMKPGDLLKFRFEIQRNRPFHCMHFAWLTDIFHNQEVFHTYEDFRQWAERGAGHTEVLEFEGLEFERVRSVSYEELDDAQFRVLHERVKAFLLSAQALHKLWPHAEIGAAYSGVLALMERARNAASHSA